MGSGIGKKELVYLSKILSNYRINFYKAICNHKDILDELTNLPVYFIDDSRSNAIVNHVVSLNQKLLEKIAKLTAINGALLKVQNINQMVHCINKYDVLNLDKDIIQMLDKQQKILKTCKNKGYVSNVMLRCFEEIYILTNNLYLTSINQIEICEGYINNYLKTDISEQDDLEQ